MLARSGTLESSMHGGTVEDDISNVCEPSDFDLLKDVADGREESFRLLFSRWAPRLGRFLIRATGSPETGEDLLQEAFLRVLNAADRFEKRGSVGAWMYRICANLVYSHWRRERSSPFRTPSTTDGDGSIEMATPVSESPDRIRVRRAFTDAAVSALKRCPENQKMVFLLKVDSGLTYEEIAGILRCPVGTAKSRFHLAVRRLRDDLKDWNDTPHEGRNHDVL